MIVGGAMFIPAYAIMLWVTVGNGLRHGLSYLFGATLLSLLSLGIIYMFTPYWQENPYILATLALTTLLIPAYAYGLLDNLRKARDSAAKANLAKSRFLAYASHDLRQPVQAASLLVAHLRHTKLHHDQITIVDDIADALRSVTDLFQSLLDVSTLDSGGITPRPEPVELNAFLTEIVHRNAAVAEKAGVHLKFVPTKAWIITDRQLLAAILQNVISNALKYAPGKPVLIGCKRHNQCITLKVCDRGPGIPNHHIDHIFDDFYRGRPASNIEGMGLGLPIAQRLAHLLGLEISLRSVCGSGTTVTIKGLKECGDL
jgi:signal transduction histidine kinase